MRTKALHVKGIAIWDLFWGFFDSMAFSAQSGYNYVSSLSEDPGAGWDPDFMVRMLSVTHK